MREPTFWILTALASLVYYRRRVLSGVWSSIVLGVLPLGAVGFLAWMLIKSLVNAPATQRWSLAGVVVAGVPFLFVGARHHREEVQLWEARHEELRHAAHDGWIEGIDLSDAPRRR